METSPNPCFAKRGDLPHPLLRKEWRDGRGFRQMTVSGSNKVDAQERTNEGSLRDHAERNLGAIVIAIEFTLISVMVGVILFPLMDYAMPLLRDLRIEYWLYIVSGLLLILYMWTEVISHALSFIGWPINIGHNLLYIVFAMILAIQMHFLADPRGWFAMNLASASMGSVLFYYDLRVIRDRMVGATGSAKGLFESARDRQSGLVHLAPYNIGNALLQVGLVVLLPGIFVERPGHVVLVAIQIGALLFFMSRTIRNFGAWSEPIVRKAMEELAAEVEA
jgi:hypothetical protein